MFAETGLRVSRYFPRAQMALHQHDAVSMNIVVSGKFLERIGRVERVYARGTASFCPAATMHSQQFGATAVRQITFKPQPSWLDYLADCKTWLVDAPHMYSTTIRHLGDKLLEEIRHDDGFSAVACEGIMLEIVAAFGRSGSEAAVRTNPPAWLRAARDFIHENAFASLSIRSRMRQDVTKFILRENSADSSASPLGNI